METEVNECSRIAKGWEQRWKFFIILLTDPTKTPPESQNWLVLCGMPIIQYSAESARLSVLKLFTSCIRRGLLSLGVMATWSRKTLKNNFVKFCVFFEKRPLTVNFHNSKVFIVIPIDVLCWWWFAACDWVMSALSVTAVIRRRR